MPGAASQDKQAFFSLAISWAQRLRSAAYPESAAALYVQANRGARCRRRSSTADSTARGCPSAAAAASCPRCTTSPTPALNSALVYSAVLCCAVLSCTLSKCTVLHTPVLHCTVLSSTAALCSILSWKALYPAVLGYPSRVFTVLGLQPVQCKCSSSASQPTARQASSCCCIAVLSMQT